MINPSEEAIERNQKLDVRLSDLTFEYYRLSETKKDAETKMKELDLQITDLLAKAQTNKQAARDFDTYLAVKEGAVTLGDVKKAVETKVPKNEKGVK